MTVHDHIAPGLAFPATEPVAAPVERASVHQRHATIPGWALEALVWVGIVGLGAAVRWPNLWLIPTFTDETAEALRGMAIYRGEIAPLTNDIAYIGALWNYVL